MVDMRDLKDKVAWLAEACCALRYYREAEQEVRIAEMCPGRIGSLAPAVIAADTCVQTVYAELHIISRHYIVYMMLTAASVLSVLGTVVFIRVEIVPLIVVLHSLFRVEILYTVAQSIEFESADHGHASDFKPLAVYMMAVLLRAHIRHVGFRSRSLPYAHARTCLSVPICLLRATSEIRIFLSIKRKPHSEAYAGHLYRILRFHALEIRHHIEDTVGVEVEGDVVRIAGRQSVCHVQKRSGRCPHG